MHVDQESVPKDTLNSSSLSESNEAQTKDKHPRITISKGLRANDIDAVSRGIEAFIAKEPGNVKEILAFSVFWAAYEEKPDMVKYLLDQWSAPIERLSPSIVSTSRSADMFQFLIDRGWDINQSDRKDQAVGYQSAGQRLLQHVVSDEDLVCWCLDHGATVEDGPFDVFKCPPLLESVAAWGTVKTWKLLRSRGAQMGRKMLHRAAEHAALSSGDAERLSIHMEMVKFLVEELKLDVNALDTEWPVQPGTPLVYAANASGGGTEIVHYLLERGADPTIKDCYGMGALHYVETHKNGQVAEMLRKWVEQHGRQ